MSLYFGVFFVGWLILLGLIGGAAGFFSPELIQLAQSDDPLLRRFFPIACLLYVLARLYWIKLLWMARNTTRKRFWMWATFVFAISTFWSRVFLFIFLQTKPSHWLAFLVLFVVHKLTQRGRDKEHGQGDREGEKGIYGSLNESPRQGDTEASFSE